MAGPSSEAWASLVRDLMDQENYSQRGFAERAGISRTALRKLVAGKSEITVSILERVLRALGYELEALKVRED